ncbi:MAG TPA: antitoxin family protein [Pirellulales bacterium]|jgi:predicted DNA-binding antitoxin AbrB/MazE fold protein
MSTINAHFDGHVFIPDQPVDLAQGEAVELDVRRRGRPITAATELIAQLPLVRIAPEDAEAINRDSQFDVEES